MKYCPQCQQRYSRAHRFCRTDGSKLLPVAYRDSDQDLDTNPTLLMPDDLVHEEQSIDLGKAVGVKLAMPDRQVICSVGDGTALYTIQGLWTAARYKLGGKFVVFNNQSYMILKGGLVAMKGASAERGVFVGMDIREPEIDFVKLAESMGVAARRASNASELRPALEWSFAESHPTLVDVSIARDVRSVLR
jgi:thiamine pyrophosphate-dependent acetolactate synthase large subunit-like protein